MFVETASVSGNWYGTPRCDANDKKIFVVDPNGAREFMKLYPQILKIFIMAPSLSELRRRLIDRGQDSEGVIEHRMNDYQELVMARLWYDHVLINDDLGLCVKDVCRLLSKEKSAR